MGDSRIYSVGHALRRDGYAINIGHGLPDDAAYAQSDEIFGAPGAACLIRAELIADLAPAGELYDARMFMYSEDVDLDWRARRRGWRCWYAADAVAYHTGSNPGPRLKAHAIGNRYLAVLKNACWRDLIIYNLPLILLHCGVRLLVTAGGGVVPAEASGTAWAGIAAQANSAANGLQPATELVPRCGPPSNQPTNQLSGTSASLAE